MSRIYCDSMDGVVIVSGASSKLSFATVFSNLRCSRGLDVSFVGELFRLFFFLLDLDLDPDLDLDRFLECFCFCLSEAL